MQAMYFFFLMAALIAYFLMYKLPIKKTNYNSIICLSIIMHRFYSLYWLFRYRHLGV
jgi:hypothetical protein